MMNFRQWLEFYGSSQTYDQGLRRTMTMPMFHVMGTNMPGEGLVQSDPMYSTLHGKPKPSQTDKSPARRLFQGKKKKKKKKD